MKTLHQLENNTILDQCAGAHHSGNKSIIELLRSARRIRRWYSSHLESEMHKCITREVFLLTIKEAQKLLVESMDSDLVLAVNRHLEAFLK
jgi:hypothetical protein